MAALLAFVTLVIGLSTAALFYTQMKAVSLREALATFERISVAIRLGTQQLRLEIENALTRAAGGPLSRAKTFADRVAAKDDLWPILEASPYATNAFIGYPNGDFLLLRRVLPIDHPPAWLRGSVVYVMRGIEHRGGRELGRFWFYGKDRKLLAVRDESTFRYDPRRRPWWRAGTREVMISEPYFLFAERHLVVGLSLASTGGSVVGADVELADLSDVETRLLPTRSSLAVLVRAVGGAVFGYSDRKALDAANSGRPQPAKIADLHRGVLSAAFRAAQDNPPNMEAKGTYRDSRGREWLYEVTPGKSADGRVLLYPTLQDGKTVYLPRALLILASPQDELIADALRVRNYALVICLALILAMIPIAYWMARFISVPLGRLRGDALAIRRLDFTDRPSRDSFITEVGEFDETFQSMRTHVRGYNEAVTHFIPGEFLEQLGRADITSLRLGDHRESVMTMLFSDIRAFTTLSGAMTPDETFRFVNSYLTQIGPIIRQKNGFIDKYIGDAIFALFPGPPADGVEAAIEMQRRVVIYNEGRARAGYAPIAIGVGVHRGSLMLGTIGEEQRYETTVIADAVNIAARMEGLTKVFGALILATADVVNEIDEAAYCLRNLGPVQMKGATHPVTVYEVCDADRPGLFSHKKATREQFEIARVAFTLGDFGEAHRIFTDIAGEGADRAAIYFRDRAAEMAAAHGSTSSWDGVERMETK